MKGAKVPVAFIPVPYSGSSIADWQCNEAWPDDPGTLYGNMLRRVTRAGGAVRAVLLWQGEWDAGSGQVDEASYESALRALAEATQRDLGVRLVVCQTGEIRWRQSTPPVAPFLDGIRMAQLHSWAWSDVVAPGPELYDILLHTATEDRVHYRTPEQLATVSRRWWCAVAAGCYDQGDGRGPRITGATYEAAGPSITLQFTDDDPAAQPSGRRPGGGVHSPRRQRRRHRHRRAGTSARPSCGCGSPGRRPVPCACRWEKVTSAP